MLANFIILYMHKKNPIHWHHHQSYWKSLWVLKSWCRIEVNIIMNTMFPKFKFLLESWNFIIGNKYYWWFPWIDRLTVYFLRNCLSNIQIWKTTSWSAVLSYKNYVLWKKRCLVQLAVQTGTQGYSLRQPSLFGLQKCFMCLSYVATQNIKKMCIWQLKFCKINNFDCFKDILKWNWLFKKKCLVMKNMTISTICYHVFDSW